MTTSGMNLSSPMRRLVGRVVMTAVQFAIGFVLVFYPKQWGASAVIAQVGSVPHILAILGWALMFGAALTVKLRTRDVGYMVGAVFFTINIIGGAYALLAHKHVSALAIGLIVLCWIYVESSITATRDRENDKFRRLKEADVSLDLKG